MFFSIVMPAFKAQKTIVQSVNSALRQTHTQFELIISADDEEDYQAHLAQSGIIDERLKFTKTGGVGTGSSNARNVGMQTAASRYIVVLDADDLLHRQKLERLGQLMKHHPVVTTGLQVIAQNDAHLFCIACDGETKHLNASTYKFTNISMDSMVAFDRWHIPVSYDVELPCLVDLGLMLEVFCYVDNVVHIAEPLHFYRKQMGSISNSSNSSPRYQRIKSFLLNRLETGHYPLVGGDKAIKAMIRFLNLSLEAEATFPTAQQAGSQCFFENHLRRHMETAI